jgi:hypothetical protein
MTCTVTIAIPQLSLAGADTRLNIFNNGSWERFDARVGAFELNSGRSLSIPDGLRKIRCIGGAWTASTGDAVTTQLAFSTLQTIAMHAETLAADWAITREGVRALSHSESGYPFEEIDKSRILVALSGSAPQVQTLAFSNDSTVKPGNYVITWPPGIDDADSNAASTAFIASLRTAVSTFNLCDVIRSVITVIKFASERCPTVGPLVQIGFTIGVAQHFRIEGDASELLRLSDADLQLRFLRTNEQQ